VHGANCAESFGSWEVESFRTVTERGRQNARSPSAGVLDLLVLSKPLYVPVRVEVPDALQKLDGKDASCQKTADTRPLSVGRGVQKSGRSKERPLLCRETVLGCLLLQEAPCDTKHTEGRPEQHDCGSAIRRRNRNGGIRKTVCMMRLPVWVIDCKAKQGWSVIEPSCVYSSTGQDVKEVVSLLRDRDYTRQIERKPKRDNIPQRCSRRRWTECPRMRHVSLGSRWYGRGEIASSTKRSGLFRVILYRNPMVHCCRGTQIDRIKYDITGHVDFSDYLSSLSLLTEKPAAEQANRQSREDCF